MNNGILRDRLLVKGEIVAQFLNVAEGLVKQKRVIDLLERYRDLQHLLPAVVAGRPLGRAEGGPFSGALAFDLRENKRADRLVKQINRLLARYRFRRAVTSVVYSDARQERRRTEFVGDDPYAARIETATYPVRRVPFSKFERGSTIEEHGAVEYLIELATAGELDRLRKCAFCSKWFMASRTDRIYHEGCAAKQHRKERKDSGIAAEYQKWYRKYAPVKLRKRQLEEKWTDGFHLSKAERDELRQVTEETKRLKDEWIKCRTAPKGLMVADFEKSSKGRKRQ